MPGSAGRAPAGGLRTGPKGDVTNGAAHPDPGGVARGPSQAHWSRH